MQCTVIGPLDRAILAELVRDGRRSYREIATEVGLGATATADRVRRLFREGVLVRISAVVDPVALGRGLQAVVDVQLRPDVTGTDFEATLADVPAVLSAVHVTGPADYLLDVACTDPQDLDATLAQLKRAGAERTETHLILRRVDVPDPWNLARRPGRRPTRRR